MYMKLQSGLMKALSLLLVYNLYDNHTVPNNAYKEDKLEQTEHGHQHVQCILLNVYEQFDHD